MNKLIPCLLLLVSTQVHGQTTAQLQELALTSFFSKDFPATIFYCEKVIQDDETDVSSLFFAGESARLMNDLTKAESYLEKIPEEAKTGYYSVTDYEIGLVKYGLDKKDEAKKYFESYLDKHFDDSNLYSLYAKKAIKSLATGKSDIELDNYLNKLPENINSDVTESAPLRYADKLYYSSVVTENYLPTKNKRKKKRMEEHPITRIYESKFNSVSITSKANPRSAILNSSNVALMPDASRMYYTLCSDENPNEQEHCTIWYRNRRYDGSWASGVKLPEEVNKRQCTNTQPTVGYDWKLKKYVLYFVSNRPGGVGGKDIWACEIERDNSFGEPYLLPFNTIEDDVTPYFHQQTQTLFYSSNGMQGNGGFDIFHTEKTSAKTWTIPENLGPYLNTSKDETYYTYHTSSNFAYYVSNDVSQKENGGDIMEARVFLEYELRTFDNESKLPLTPVKVEIKNTKTGAVGVLKSSELSHVTNLKLALGADYRISVSPEGYKPYTFHVSTDNVSYIQKREKNIFLDTKPVVKP